MKRNDKGAYVVQRQTRFPAGLSVETFIVPKGVPMPDGDPVHACVIAEDPAVKSRGF